EAGSDAANVKTRGVRVEGGWRVTGQKIWTSGAQNSQLGFATVRTDSSGKKHAGVTMMVIDMHADGVEVRPLREITGEALFNEVFFDDVFVPDSDVVGEVGAGWAVARATLGNERVTIGGSSEVMGFSEDELVALWSQSSDVRYVSDVGGVLGDRQVMRMLNLRQATRAVQGSGPGPEGNLNKMLTAEHNPHVTELALKMLGSPAVVGESRATWAYLFHRCATIAGGTSEITRNQIAERLLGMPRDPLLA
ncbi:acyl-CoA dehydrogenase family protein, partial [Jatrophihabitans sp.]|uniref:acyl-CoA dehydrogenase family protein n=1 Tax=Jatrophihabitans sp. TaxID=1932789 RepID=UPI0030C76AB5|nr:Acyl-CoA dehydrogenase fadE12 [Jatrophihabitans sp.]